MRKERDYVTGPSCVSAPLAIMSVPQCCYCAVDAVEASAWPEGGDEETTVYTEGLCSPFWRNAQAYAEAAAPDDSVEQDNNHQALSCVS